MKKILLVLLLAITQATGQVAPILYYTFDTTNPYDPAVGSGAFSTGGSSIVAGKVGNCMSQLQKSASYTSLVGAQFTSTTAVSIQFLMRGGYNFLNNRKATLVRWGNITITFGVPAANIQYNNITYSYRTTAQASSENLVINLDGIDRKSLTYYTDDNWHQYVFILNAIQGRSEVYVDGQLLATGSPLAGNVAIPTDNKVYINTNTLYDQFYGYMDEVALYSAALTPSQIYQNYTDFVAGNHYTTSLYTGTIPAPPVYTTANDTMDYPIGYVLGSGTSANVPTSAYNQIKQFDFPRYYHANTLKPLFNWSAPDYVGGLLQTNISDPQIQAVAIQNELWKNYNYSLLVSSNVSTQRTADLTDTTTYSGKYVALAKTDTSKPTAAITFWAQTGSQTINDKTLPANYYLRNSGGSFLTQQGVVTTTPSQKVLSPAAPPAPMSSDGVPVKTKMTAIKNAISPATLDYVNENDEVIALLDSAAMLLDPAVVTDKNNSGLDWRPYFGSRYKQFSWAYRDTFMAVVPTASFSMYRIDGQDGSLGYSYYGANYSQRRLINTKVGGRNYSTFDFYPRYPWNYRVWSTAFRGLQGMQEARYVEISLGDKVCSPFISPGWNTNEENNMRPGRWLGLLKILNVWGADFFYTGFFNDASSYTPPNPPPAHPKGYIWQLVMPSYAQGVASRYETILKTGVHTSNTPADYTKPSVPGYILWAGDPRIFVAARQDSTNSNHYIITATIQPSTNGKGNAPDSKTAKFLIGSDTICVEARQQGSTYDYYNNSNTIRQLDTWHEKSHPQRWSTNYVVEAEVCDSTDAQFSTTDVTTSTNKKDYTAFTSYAYGDTTYYFPRMRYTGNYYLWVRARLSGGSPQNLNVNCSGGATLSKDIQVNTTYWAWYRLDALADTLKFTYSSTLNSITTRLYIPATVQVDKLFFTQSDTVLTPQAPVATCPTISISFSATNVTCNGASTGTITATPSGGASPYTYLWSTIPSQSSQTATGLSSGTYTVTVTDANGCTKQSSRTITQGTAITATPSSSNATCGNSNGSASVSASGGAGSFTYLWSTGGTTTSISSLGGGTYTVTVTDASGCTKQAFATVANTAAGTLSLVSQTNISCNGGATGAATVRITSTSRPVTWLWAPSGGTDSVITGRTAGTYIITATEANGCKSSLTVTLTQPAVLATAISATNVSCNSGANGSLTVSVSGGTAPYTYLWSNASTSTTISGLASGTYTVTVTDANSCTTSRSASVTQPAALSLTVNTAGVGCGDSAYTIVSGGVTPYFYLWSTGSTATSITGIAAGTYTVTVTDSKGCTISANAIMVSCDTACVPPDTLWADNIQKYSARVNFDGVTTALSYQVYLYDLTTQRGRYYSVGKAYTTITLYNLVNNRRYKVRVRSYCNLGGYAYSSWSSYIYIKTLP